MSIGSFTADQIVCHCLGITGAEVRTSAAASQNPTVRCVMKSTDAGTGCTACHRRIRAIIAEQQAEAALPSLNGSFPV